MGRKKQEIKRQPLQVYLYQDDINKLNEEAEKREITISQLLRDIIKSYLQGGQNNDL